MNRNLARQPPALEPAPRDEVIIRLEGVAKDYVKNGVTVPALRGIDLAVRRGEFAAVAGPSGSGKTTLLNIVGGLDRPTAGTVEVAGLVLNGLPGAELARLRRENIGFVFQTHNLLPVLTALENAEYVLMLHGRPRRERAAAARALLAEVGLAGLEDRFPRELSGGQRQRVAIARAVAAGPDLILADEPTANVDTRTASGILDLLRRLNRERNVTILYSSHDPAVLRRADAVYRLTDGLLSGPERPGADPEGPR